jgi:chemotaxis protein methyltransferase CheR
MTETLASRQAPGIPILTEAEFVRFQQFLEQHTGIHLSDAKRPLLVARLARRLRQLGMTSFSAYYDHVIDDRHLPERTAMFDAVSTNETHFFREPRQFELLRATVFPQWKTAAAEGTRAKSIKVWSAGCSTGEEPYSLAMLLLEHFDSSEWELRVEATDLSTRVLETARRGVWPIRKASEIPTHLRRRFMLRGTGAQEGSFKAGEDVRSIIRIGRLNLNDDVYPMSSDFDLILCRNVLIYFTHAQRAKVTANLLSHLVPGGYFLLGHSETLSGVVSGPRSVIPTVYVR